MEVLAAKLGTTVEYLWGVMLSQAPVAAMNNLIFIVTTTVLTWLCVRRHKKLIEPIDEYRNGYDEVANVTLMICWLVVCAVGVIASLFLIPATVTALVNPEYWALKQILN